MLIPATPLTYFIVFLLKKTYGENEFKIWEEETLNLVRTIEFIVTILLKIVMLVFYWDIRNFLHWLWRRLYGNAFPAIFNFPSHLQMPLKRNKTSTANNSKKFRSRLGLIEYSARHPGLRREYYAAFCHFVV